MIHLIHGTDTASSYERYNSLLSTYKNQKILRITKDEASKLVELLTTEDMFEEKKVVAASNLIEKKLIDLKKIPKIQDNTTLIFYEESEITAAQLKKLSNAKVENFKLPSLVFTFLDSITPGSRSALKMMQSLEPDSSLLWRITNRLFMMLLAKLNFSREQVSKITSTNLAPWQWQKIFQQSKLYEYQNLKKMFESFIKIDLMIKTGKTSIPQEELITMALFKHLKIKN